jgi:hypothetical protein
MTNYIWPMQEDFMLEVSRQSQNKYANVMFGVNKFGRSTNVDSGVDTDIWDGANATDDQDIWVAPTQARVHNIVSTSTSDDGDPVGVGARTLRVYGLTAWDSPETSEDIIMNGTTDVATTNSYVIIHRMKVLTKGATSSNVGVITATAVTDGTITAQINAGNGQTLMAIYGIPSGYTFYMTELYASILKTGATGLADCSLLFNPEPDAELTNFLVKHTFGAVSTGSSNVPKQFKPYNPFVGPGILKVQANGSAANLDVSAGFDGILAID